MDPIDRAFFDAVHNRRGTGSIKYDRHLPSSYPGEILPMWIADMDFPSPPAVEEALRQAADSGIYGYTDADADYDTLVAAWYRDRFGWDVRRDWIVHTPGVMFGIAAAIRALSDPGDGVLICQPVYYPFAKIIPANGRRLVVSPLVLRGGRYEIDFEDLENRIRDQAVRLFLLCSPHNPVGRVWTREELTEIGRICCRYGVRIISDEIHSDFVFTPRRHLPIASLSDELAQWTVTCTSPTKTFNLAGLQAGNLLIPNESIRRKVRRECLATGCSHLNMMAVAATKAAYGEGAPWLDSLLGYLRSNYDMIRGAFPKNGLISLIRPEGTYLAWLDCRRLGLTDNELEDLFLNRAGVQLHSGSVFGTGGSGFVRMNIACPQSVLLEAIARIGQAVRDAAEPAPLPQAVPAGGKGGQRLAVNS